MSTTDQPTVPEFLRRLERLLGVWVVSGSMTTADGSAPVSGRWQFSRVADGHGLSMAGRTTIEGMGGATQAMSSSPLPWRAWSVQPCSPRKCPRSTRRCARHQGH
jgi:hypothetical protein